MRLRERALSSLSYPAVNGERPALAASSPPSAGSDGKMIGGGRLGGRRRQAKHGIGQGVQSGRRPPQPIRAMSPGVEKKGGEQRRCERAGKATAVSLLLTKNHTNASTQHASHRSCSYRDNCDERVCLRAPLALLECATPVFLWTGTFCVGVPPGKLNCIGYCSPPFFTSRHPT